MNGHGVQASSFGSFYVKWWSKPRHDPYKKLIKICKVFIIYNKIWWSWKVYSCMTCMKSWKVENKVVWLLELYVSGSLLIL